MGGISRGEAGIVDLKGNKRKVENRGRGREGKGVEVRQRNANFRFQIQKSRRK